jgi:Type I phosphodiesterase / nucleotide pyrophosphatase
MSNHRASRFVTSVVSAAALSAALFGGGAAVSADDRRSDTELRHVLLISVDGLHEFDRRQWVNTHPNSMLARLSADGTTYTQASTSTPSDSFPGLLAQVTGGTPETTGVFYDDSYSRSMWARGSNCAGAPGAEVTYAGNPDTTVNGLIPLFPQPPIDPANLPLGHVHGTCQGIYPHSFLQTNTIFEVAHDAGRYTAWSDKHPAYEIVRGPENVGADDLFTPEINTTQTPDPTTISVAATSTYDQLKVAAVLNEIDGKSSDGSQRKPVPAIFGMNFQSVSVGQKLVNPVLSCVRNPQPSNCDPNYVPGGYEPGTLAFTPQMEQAMTYVDGAIGSMLDELRARHLVGSTTIIVSAKHGQSPIDPAKLHKIGDAVTPILTNAGIDVAQNTEDDISLIWLKDQRQTRAAVQALEADKNGANAARIQTIIAGDALADRFGDPRRNDRTPDIIVQPIPGTIYTGSKAKVAEHGGFAEDDTHVALIVFSGGDRHHDVVGSRVETRQIAPTILRLLDLNPEALRSVRLEGTRALPDR